MTAFRSALKTAKGKGTRTPSSACVETDARTHAPLSRYWLGIGLVATMALAWGVQPQSADARGPEAAGHQLTSLSVVKIVKVPDTTYVSALACQSAMVCEAAAQHQTNANVTDRDFAVRGNRPGRSDQVRAASIVLGAACPNHHGCLMVGDSRHGLAGVLLAYRNGQLTNSRVVRGVDGLSAIACTGTRSCVAVGMGTQDDGTFVELSNGKPAKPVVVPGVAELNGVACAAHGRCVAVGQTRSDRAVEVQIDHGVPGIPEAFAAKGQLTGVACETSAHCLAVGNTLAGGGLAVQIGVGSHPRVRHLKMFAYAVACTTRNTCVITGASSSARGSSGEARLYRNDRFGSTVRVPAVNGLGATACPTSSRCLVSSGGLKGDSEGAIVVLAMRLSRQIASGTSPSGTSMP